MTEFLGRLGSPRIGEWSLDDDAHRALERVVRDGGVTRVGFVDPSGVTHSYDVEVVEPEDRACVVIVDRTATEQWRARAHALARQRLVGSIMTGVVHDLNNVLGRIVGVTEAMIPLAKTKQDRAFFAAMIDSSARGATLLRNLDRVLDAGAESSARTPVVPILPELIGTVRKGAPPGWALEATIEPDLADVTVREDLLVEAVLALLVFCRVTAETGSTLHVHARSNRVAGVVEVAMRDHGDPNAAVALAEWIGMHEPGAGLSAAGQAAGARASDAEHAGPDQADQRAMRSATLAGPASVELEAVLIALIDLGMVGGDLRVAVDEGRELVLTLPIAADPPASRSPDQNRSSESR